VRSQRPTHNQGSAGPSAPHDDSEGNTHMKNPPILISVIGFFAALAGFAWLFLGLRILGFDWFTLLGDVEKFEQSGLWGWLAISAGILWILVAVGLWALQPWAWLFAMIVAGISLFEAFLWMLEYPGTGLGLGMAIMPLLIILYLNGSAVKAAFGMKDPPPAA
jgi:hypothetical protein